MSIGIKIKINIPQNKISHRLTLHPAVGHVAMLLLRTHLTADPFVARPCSNANKTYVPIFWHKLNNPMIAYCYYSLCVFIYS